MAAVGGVALLGLEAFAGEPVELQNNATEADLQAVMRTVYKQVFGNAHLMECDRNLSSESLLRNGDITVRGFVKKLARSQLYRSLFFDCCSPYRFIELNFKHLLGRAPLDQSEISQHVRNYIELGYEAEIDSYIDSDEYLQNFGENIVPYPRSLRTQVGSKNIGFNRMVTLIGGAAKSDRGDNRAKLTTSVAANLPQTIKVSAVMGSGTYSNTGKRFRIVMSTIDAPGFKKSTAIYEVGFAQLSQKIQNIHKMGGKILSITEVG